MKVPKKIQKIIYPLMILGALWMTSCESKTTYKNRLDELSSKVDSIMNINNNKIYFEEWIKKISNKAHNDKKSWEYIYYSSPYQNKRHFDIIFENGNSEVKLYFMYWFVWQNPIFKEIKYYKWSNDTDNIDHIINKIIEIWKNSNP